jgi:hypothetical protein
MLTSCLLILVLFSPTQDPHQAMADRGAMVMGFDQAKTTHHFYLYTDGGAIEISVKDATDITDRDAIRGHLPHLATMFTGGDFDAPMLVHDTKNVPGVDVLAKRKDSIKYVFAETPLGGRVNMVTTDTDALAALHAFLIYQIKEHQTGDSVKVTKRQ